MSCDLGELLSKVPNEGVVFHAGHKNQAIGCFEIPYHLSS